MPATSRRRAGLGAAGPVASLGGQAVYSGVMIRASGAWAVAVRREDGETAVVTHVLAQPGAGRRLPLVRGVLAAADSFRIGLAAIRESTRLAQPDGPVAGRAASAVAVSGAVLVNVALFLLTPSLIAGAVVGRGRVGYGLVDGAARLSIFIASLAAVRRSRLGRALFSWHGAEHQVIAAFERGCPDVVSGAASCSRLHPRCGTNFLFLVFVLDAGVDALIALGGPFGALARLAAVPIVAAVSYELLRFAGRPGATAVARLLALPGLGLQLLTTAPPDAAQRAVAAAALAAALDRAGYTPA